MSGKSAKLNRRLIRKETNKIKKMHENEVIIELFRAPFKYRLKFALKLLRGKKGLLIGV